MQQAEFEQLLQRFSAAADSWSGRCRDGDGRDAPSLLGRSRVTLAGLLTCDADGAAVRHDAHAITDANLDIRFLHNHPGLPGVVFHGDL